MLNRLWKNRRISSFVAASVAALPLSAAARAYDCSSDCKNLRRMPSSVVSSWR